VQMLLDYVHGLTRSISSDMARPLFKLADQYGIQGLARACSSKLINDLTPNLIPEILELCDMHSNAPLMAACVDFVQQDRCVGHACGYPAGFRVHLYGLIPMMCCVGTTLACVIHRARRLLAAYGSCRRSTWV
jgi:hypothetical protein